MGVQYESFWFKEYDERSLLEADSAMAMEGMELTSEDRERIRGCLADPSAIAAQPVADQCRISRGRHWTIAQRRLSIVCAKYVAIRN